MKKKDFILIAVVVVVVLPFFIFPEFIHAYNAYQRILSLFGQLCQIALLATSANAWARALRSGVYNKPGFGTPRGAWYGVSWDTIKVARHLGEGSPLVLKTLGVHFPTEILPMCPATDFPDQILRRPDVGPLNLLFARVFMTFTGLPTCIHAQPAVTLKFLTRPCPYNRRGRLDHLLNRIKKPFRSSGSGKTLNFMLLKATVLVAALYSIILGVLLSLASLMAMKRH